MPVRYSGLVLIFALLVSPLSLLIRSSSRGASRCNGICCRPQGSRARLGADQRHESRTRRTPCGRGTNEHAAICLINTNPQSEYTFAAPLRPATLCEQARMTGPQLVRQTSAQQTETALAGFLPIPFEPPRS
jgi:hypothetical protein